MTRAGYYPNKKSILIKLVADKKSRRILGAQIVGGEAVKGRIDLLAFALLVRATVDNLANYDACYVPPVSPVWEPINIAAFADSKAVRMIFRQGRAFSVICLASDILGQPLLLE